MLKYLNVLKSMAFIYCEFNKQFKLAALTHFDPPAKNKYDFRVNALCYSSLSS